MRTDHLISMLASGASQELTGRPWRNLSVAIGIGTVASTFLMLKVISVNPELGATVQLLEFWQKLGFAMSIALISLLLVVRLSQPGVSLGKAPMMLPAPVLGIWILAGMALAGAEQEHQAALFFGNTWKACPFLIAMLASPVFVTTMWAMSDLAPTRLKLAGAVAGLFSGAVGAVVYCFHCPELDAPFIGVWYLLGILIPAVIGALLGPKLLRW